MYKTTKRDDFVWKAANLIINLFATKEYKAFLYALIKQGTKSFDNRMFYKPKYNSDIFDLPDASRVLVSIHGRDFEQWNLKNVELSIQDDGRTLKVFAKEQEKF